MNRIIIVAVILLVYFVINSEQAIEVPAVLASSAGSDVKKIQKYEFTSLLSQKKPTENLAVKDHYTIVEGYINTCSICKKLEARFTPFLDKRNDVVIRRLHFPESGFSLSFNSQEEVIEHGEAMALYRFNHVINDGQNINISTCGTPHIEIYGPDKKLIASDVCGEKNLKEGLSFLRKWMKAEGV